MARDTTTLSKGLPATPGVYLMRGARGDILYIGKAANLKRRVSSYFARAHEYRIEKLVNQIRKIDYKKTDTAVEALILEAGLIKKYQPPYNVLEKDDTSFLYVVITKEEFPRVLLVRGKDIQNTRLAPSLIGHSPNSSTRPPAGRAGKREELGARFSAGYGPFTSASSIRYALKLIRRIFPFSKHQDNANTTNQKTNATKGDTHSLHSSKNSYHSDYARQRPCFDYQIGLCPGTCIEAVSKAEYAKTIRNIKLFFRGKKTQIVRALKNEMRRVSKTLEFEKAEKLRRQIFSLQHIQDIALISDDGVQRTTHNLPSGFRIEGYDISNISGASAAGSMVVFIDGKPDTSQYRKFRIRTVLGSDDTGMLREVLERRLRTAWRKPDLMLVDGGIGQVSTARFVLRKHKIDIPVVGIAKGPTRKKSDIVGAVPSGIDLRTLVRVRNEAHRFAIRYHRSLRGALALSSRV